MRVSCPPGPGMDASPYLPSPSPKRLVRHAQLEPDTSKLIVVETAAAVHQLRTPVKSRIDRKSPFFACGDQRLSKTHDLSALSLDVTLLGKLANVSMLRTLLGQSCRRQPDDIETSKDRGSPSLGFKENPRPANRSAASCMQEWRMSHASLGPAHF